MEIILNYLGGPESSDKRRRTQRRLQKVEAEIGVMWPQDKKHLESPEVGRGKKEFSPRAFKRNRPH